MTTYAYLHGLGSSPKSTKGLFLEKKFKDRGLKLHLPDLNRPTFETLTISAQVAEVERLVDACGRPAVLIGSSLGGLAAAAFAQRHPDRVEKLVLLCPAVRFIGDRLASMAGSSLEAWRTTGRLMLPHFSDGTLHPVHYGLVEDVAQLGIWTAVLSVPMKLIHGTRDEVIPIQLSREWASRQPDASLTEIPGGDHSLGQHQELLWSLISDFLWDGAER